MRILFINTVIKADYSSLDVAITLLATIINKNSNHQAAIADTTFHSRDWKKYIISKIKDFEPDMFAFSCNNLYMEDINMVAKFLKNEFPQTPIIGGGYYTTMHPEDSLSLDCFDGVVVGDGEEPILKILDFYSNNEELPKSVDGFWIKTGNGIIKNNPGRFSKNISDYPFLDWDLWEDLDKYFYFLQMLYFVGSRGCPYRCSFCEACEIGDYVDGNYFRQMEPRRFAQEIAYQWSKYKHRGMKLAQIFDPVFTIKKDWILEFADEYSKLVNPRTHPISVFSRVDNLDEEKISILKKCGCKIVRMGVESGDDYIRNKIHEKMVTTRQIIDMDKKIKSNRMVATYYYILGSPGEDRDKINKTIKLALRLNASRTAFFVYKPLTKKSFELIKSNNSEVDMEKMKKTNNLQYDSVIKLKDITPKEIEKLQFKAYLKFLLKKIPSMIKEQKLFYFYGMVLYISKGLFYGLKLKYLLPYYHIYAYDNVTK